MKTIIRNIALTSAFFAAAYGIKAQQNIQFTHYMYNNLSINPAYAGSHQALNITGIFRKQWVGLDGSPLTTNIYAHAPIFKGLSVGLNLTHDEIGPIKYTTPNLSLSYGFRVSQKSTLAFGTSAKLNHYNGSISTLSATDPGDQFLLLAPGNHNAFNVGAGAYLYSDKYYVGFSAPDLLTDQLENFYPNSTNEVLQRHYYLMGGAIFDLSGSVKFKPSAQLKLTKNAPLSLDLSGQFLLKEKLWLGAMYRLGDAIGILVGYQFNEQLKAGYSYDFTLTKLRSVNSGSHELFISYDFFFRKKQVISPRYF